SRSSPILSRPRTQLQRSAPATTPRPPARYSSGSAGTEARARATGRRDGATGAGGRRPAPAGRGLRPRAAQRRKLPEAGGRGPPPRGGATGRRAPAGAGGRRRARAGAGRSSSAIIHIWWVLRSCTHHLWMFGTCPDDPRQPLLDSPAPGLPLRELTHVHHRRPGNRPYRCIRVNSRSNPLPRKSPAHAPRTRDPAIYVTLVAL